MSAGHPTTGTPGTYDDGDTHNYSRQAIRDEQRHHLHKAEGYRPSKSHAKTPCSEAPKVNQPRVEDQNRAMDTMISEDIQVLIKERYKTDPLFSATMHGNRPSRGAQQDAEIQAGEAEMIRKKQEKTNGMAGKKTRA
ncbi:hypothetical protein F4859DRAFT_515738 [Xylaria cf. heliscus]|nr:hypothetical protein F4859DRAFT_515738 [Xylaria cf. heliscus]